MMEEIKPTPLKERFRKAHQIAEMVSFNHMGDQIDYISEANLREWLTNKFHEIIADTENCCNCYSCEDKRKVASGIMELIVELDSLAKTGEQ